MLVIKFNTVTYVKATNNQVCVRVLWNDRKYVTTFFTGVHAELSKWDLDLHRAKRNTTHVIKQKGKEVKYSAQEINERIASFTEEIESAFYMYAMKNSIPTVHDLKTMINASMGRSKEKEKPVRKKTLYSMFQEFLRKGEREKNWDDDAKEKYTQAYNHFTSANPKIKYDDIDLDSMFNLRDWYVKNEYRNRTMNKSIIMLKSFFKYMNAFEDCTIPDVVLNFETNFKVIKRTVTFMHFDELMKFLNFKFTKNVQRLSRARDLWCFMAFTSLRYSDLKQLKTIHIIDNKRIDMWSEKTDGHLSIPLTEYALTIIERQKDRPGKGDLLFDVPSNQKLNDSIKDAAKAAGIDRKIVNTYFIGKTKHEDVNKFCDIIGCHDARRTFVSCSLAMGIPPQVVMKCTGHTGYATMKPYIDTATETQTNEMEKWNRSQYRSQIINMLDDADEETLKSLLDVVKGFFAGKTTKEINVNDVVSEESSNANTDESSDFNVMDAIRDGQLINLEYEANDEIDEIVEIEEDDYSDFSVMDAMQSGRLFHIEYSLDEDADCEDDNDQELARDHSQDSD